MTPDVLDDALKGYAPQLQVNICGRQWTLHRAASLEELWDAMTEASPAFDDERLPYWTELWPASVALAHWLWQRRDDIAGKRCLDLGCGLGLTALVGQWLGAHVLGMDYERDALRFARRNAEANTVPQPLWAVMDWRRPAVRKGCLDLLWGGDIMYERRFVTPVMDFIEWALAANGKAWIAEPCRNVYDSFRGELYNRGWKGKRIHEMVVDPIYAQPMRVTVHVWELSR